MKWARSIVNTATASIKKLIKPDTFLDGFIEVCMLSDVGCHRAQNEDQVLYIKPMGKTVESKKGFLAIVADGMGGHQAGQVASRMAVELISKYYYQTKKNLPRSLESAFFHANKEIFLSAQQNSELKGMGTTCTALTLIKNNAFVSHIGDSRLYLIRENRIERITQDHTLVQELLNQGVISSKEAEDHPNKNIVTRAMGTSLEVTFFNKGPIQVLPNDRFILCSDGLHDLVKDDELKQTVLSCTPHEACKRLIQSSKARGGYDNISVGVIAIAQDRREKYKTMATTRFD